MVDLIDAGVWELGLLGLSGLSLTLVGVFLWVTSRYDLTLPSWMVRVMALLLKVGIGSAPFGLFAGGIRCWATAEVDVVWELVWRISLVVAMTSHGLGMATIGFHVLTPPGAGAKRMLTIFWGTVLVAVVVGLVALQLGAATCHG